MRVIGHLPNEVIASAFSDYLYVQGITNLVEAEKDGWAIWIYSEDELEKAKESLRDFLTNPHDTKYKKNAQQAAELKEREAAGSHGSEAKQFDRRRLFRSTMPYGVGPLTLVLIVASVAIAFLSDAGKNQDLLNNFLITQVGLTGWKTGLPEISHGEIWRVFTPMLVHYGYMHLLFNMLCLLDVGSMIEARQSTGRLALLVLLISGLSNVAQYWVSGANFGGMSGVVYGLFGYIWMKGRFDPGSGLFLHSQTVAMMLIWFFACLFGLIPHVANTVHGVGLGVGMAWGALSSLRWLKRRTD